MKFHDQNQGCHPERSEGSRWSATEILRFAQDDNPLPILGMKTHYRGTTPYRCHVSFRADEIPTTAKPPALPCREKNVTVV